MPQTPLELLQQQVRERNTHPPAGSAPPSVLRALDAVRKLAPHKTVGVRPEEMSWDDPDAFSRTLAGVAPGDSRTVQVNPAVSMLFSDKDTSRLMGHEVEHTWQNRNADDADLNLAAAERALLPYDQRPREMAADKAATDYGFTGPEPQPWLDQFLPTIQALFRSGRK